MPAPPPFADETHVSIVVPPTDPTLGGQLTLFELERAGFEAELGAPVAFVTEDAEDGPRWLLVLDPDCETPTTDWRPGATTIVSRAKDVGGLFEALNLWRTARRAGAAVEASDCATIGEAIDRVVSEVADTYPAFELRGLDWGTICARHIEDVRRAEAPLAALQTWLAELEDSHTWVWPGHGNLPYVVEVDARSMTFVHVPTATAGFAAGVRPGWRLVALDDEVPDARAWLARTAAPPHSRPYLCGRRVLAGPAGTPRTLTTSAAGDREVSWEETPSFAVQEPVVTWCRLAPDAGYVRIVAWVEGSDEAIDAALAELHGTEKLILDLRRNPGGNLVLAAQTRDRFLRSATRLGSIRYSLGGGELSDQIPLTSEPSSGPRRWPGRLVVLTDELTFSSSEDFLLGLQGLEHVRVVGRPSGGGSGRPRHLRLLPGTTLTVSTALTYDRTGHCVEGAGVPVDVLVPRVPGQEHDAVLEVAQTL